MFHNWIPHLNAVAPQWPLRRSEALISLALILPYWFFFLHTSSAGANGFILHCHNKNNRPMKHPPWGQGVAGLEKRKKNGYVPGFCFCSPKCCSIVLCYSGTNVGALFCEKQAWKRASEVTHTAWQHGEVCSVTQCQSLEHKHPS